jgi:hypothetical protein
MRILCALALAVTAIGAATAEVTRLVVETREKAAPAKPGAPAYEILRGHYEGELDPLSAGNAVITDIEGAARLPNGKVGYSATFAIAMPADPREGSGFLVFDVPNRGGGQVRADVEGHIQVISGWQGDIDAQPGLQTLNAPTAYGSGGAPITGSVLQRFANIEGPGAPIAGSIGRPTRRPEPVSLDTRQSRLFRQPSDDAAPVDIESGDWAFANCSRKPFPGEPHPGHLCLRDGFDPDQAYTLTYQGKDPKVLGVGLAAVRDLNAFLRYAQTDRTGVPNPLAGRVRWSIVQGTSQSGNFVRSFISLGFNAAEDGRIVFDGANPNIAARQATLNIRFGVPGGAAGLYEPGSEGVLWWASYEDVIRGRGPASLLDRCTASRTCPKVVETFGSAEFWGLRMSPNLVGVDARADLPLPANVRRYYFPGVTHNGSPTGGFPPGGETAPAGAPACTLAWNPNPSSDTRRAMLRALRLWVSAGKEPPASQYPTMAGGDLVEPTADAMGWPAIPGHPTPAGKINPFHDNDFGDSFAYADLSGVIAIQPPRIRGLLPLRVPRVNADGNETSGILSVQLRVPLGTYTGWNELAQGYGAGGGCGFHGGFIPFARTEAERVARGDPRPSLEARYGDHAGFAARVRAVAAEQVAAGWLLREDADRIIAEAEASDVLR